MNLALTVGKPKLHRNLRLRTLGNEKILGKPKN